MGHSKIGAVLSVAGLLILLNLDWALSQGCTRLNVPENGFVTYDQDEMIVMGTPFYPDGTQANFNCDFSRSYALSGTDVRTCEFIPGILQEWSGDQPVCILVSCESLTLENGNVNYNMAPLQQSSNQYGIRTLATFACNDGFQLTGSESSTCTGNLVNNVLRSVDWVPETRVCSPLCDLLQPDRTRGIRGITYPGNRLLGTDAIHTCLPRHIATTSLTRRCIQSESDNSTVWGQPEEVNCDPYCSNLSAIPNGIIRYSPDSSLRLINTTATYLCDPGFELIGDYDVRICERVLVGISSVAEWNREVPICTLVCPEITPGVGIEAISYSDSNRVIGSRATHTCLPGFVQNDDLVRTCEQVNSSFADWSLPEETCRPICMDLPELMNGVIIYSSNQVPREVGTSAVYMCNDGFRYVRGSFIRNCSQVFTGRTLSGADWSGTAGECIRQCPELNPLDNGDITYNLSPRPIDYDQGTIATHSCNFGYVLSGTRERICQNSGLWSEAPPFCQPIECPPLPTVRNAVIEYENDTVPNYSLGTRASYRCNTNYILRGVDVRVCGVGVPGSAVGRWSDRQPFCEPQCPPLPEIENGETMYTNVPAPINYPVGTAATFECISGFALVGDMIRVCQNLTTWSGSQPMCEAIECPRLDPLANGIITYEVDMTANFELMTMALHTCNEGYELVGPEIRTCINDSTDPNTPVGVWDLSPPFCKPICLPLEPIPNGNITYSVIEAPSYDVGTIATYRCIAGHALIGQMTLECVSSLTWSEEPPSCQRIMCPLITNPANGRVEYAPDMMDTFELGTVANVVCDPEHNASGGPQVCSEPGDPSNPIGIWVGTRFSCDLVVCNQLPSFSNGVIIYSDNTAPLYSVGSTATYSCNTGFCLRGGSGALRECLADETWSGTVPDCALIICPLLVVPENGQITYSDAGRGLGSEATYRCLAPYELVGGQPIRTCILSDTLACPTGTWTPSGTDDLTCRITNIVNDTVTGDPLMTVPLNIEDKSAIITDSGNNVSSDDIVNLCYELHGVRDAYFNLVSDSCVSVNAHYDLVLPNDTREDINIVDSVHVRAVDDNSNCQNIEVALTDNGFCTASVGGVTLSTTYVFAGISVRVYPNRVRIGVPNCNNVDLVMWVFCRQNQFWSTYRMDPVTNQELIFTAPMIRFVIARGLNLRETSHGILGQFWNIPIQVSAFSGSIRPGVSAGSMYEITVDHPDSTPRTFVGWLYSLTWEYRSEYCLYAGNQQAGPIYEVVTPNDGVIQGAYTDYRVSTSFSTTFQYSHFNETRCN